MSEGEGEGKKGEKLQVYLRLVGEEMERFRRIKETMGLKNDTEVLRSLITWYWKTHSEELAPTLVLVSIDEKGIQIFDRGSLKLVPVLFSRVGVRCTHCEKDDCKHVNFAMEHPDVQTIVRRKAWQRRSYRERKEKELTVP